MYGKFVTTYFLTSLNLELTGIIIWLDVFQFWGDHARNFKLIKSEISLCDYSLSVSILEIRISESPFLPFGLNVFNIISHDIKGQYKAKPEHERVNC